MALFENVLDDLDLVDEDIFLRFAFIAIALEVAEIKELVPHQPDDEYPIEHLDDDLDEVEGEVIVVLHIIEAEDDGCDDVADSLGGAQGLPLRHLRLDEELLVDLLVLLRHLLEVVAQELDQLCILFIYLYTKYFTDLENYLTRLSRVYLSSFGGC